MEVDIKIIKETQKSVGKLIKRPQLTDKLLQKPPFRFLHDIIKAIIKDTGFLAGLFTPDDLDYEKIKDKESKVAFLTKLIDVVKITSGKNLTVRPSKIIAGLEAAKTNELLQAIAFCVDQKIDSKDAVQKVKAEIEVADGSKVVKPVKEKVVTTKAKPVKVNEARVVKKVEPKKNEKPEKKTKVIANKAKGPVKQVERTPEPETTSDSKTDTDKDSVKEFKKLEEEAAKHEASQEQKLEKGKGINDESQEISEQKISPQHDPSSSSKRRKSLTHADAVDSVDLKSLEPDKEEPIAIPVASEEAPNNHESSPISEPEKQSLESNEKPEKMEPAQDGSSTKRTDSGRQSRMSGRRQSTDVVSEQPNKREPSAAQKSKFIRTQSEDKMVKLRPQSVRPPSARPGAPKRRDKNIEVILQPEEIVKPASNIISKLDTLEAELEDNVDNLVIIEDPTVMNDDGIIPKTKDLSLGDVTGEKEGALVQQILETQREFTNAGAGDTNQSDTMWESPFDSRHLSSAKTEALRDSIQKLTKSVNPLGKLLDFMQEDVDSMQIELTQQLELYQTALVDMESEKVATEAAIQPFKQQLHQLRENIKFYQTAIMDVRCNILNNEQKLFKKFNEF